MSLRDLPENWQDMPLDDEQRMVDVLDLFVSNRARYDGSLFFLVCDEGSRVRAPIQIDEVTRSPLPDSDEMLENLVMAITNVGLVTSPRTPRPAPIPLVRVVLPAPRSPVRTSRSPGARRSAR